MKGLVAGPSLFFFSKDAGKSLNDVSHHKRHKNVHCHSCNRQRRVVVHLGWRVTAWQNNGKYLRNLMHVVEQNTLTFRSRTYILKSLRAFLRALFPKKNPLNMNMMIVQVNHDPWLRTSCKCSMLHPKFDWFSVYNKRNMCLKHLHIWILGTFLAILWYNSPI